MKVKEIVVRAGRTIQHPTEQYANLRPSIELRADLDEGEDFGQAVQSLQASAEQLVEDHAKQLRDSIIHREDLDREQRRIPSRS